jgi:hypothetical protein
MGGPLSTLLSEVYKQNYESNYIINNKIYSSYIKAYHRHIYDIFFLFRGSNRQTETLVYM